MQNPLKKERQMAMHFYTPLQPGTSPYIYHSGSGASVVYYATPAALLYGI